MTGRNNFLNRLILAGFLFLSFMFAFTSYVSAQDSSPPDAESDAGGGSSVEPTVDAREKIEGVLKYGIDSEVLTVLGNLRGEEDGSYNDLLTEVFSDSRNTSIKQEIFRIWSDTQYEEGLPFAREELKKVVEDDDFVTDVVRTAMSFIGEMEYEEALPELSLLVDHRNGELAAAAVRAVGSVGTGGNPEIAASLLKRLKEEDPVANEDLVASLIVTLGDVSYGPAADELILIAEDEGASSGHRRLACVSVGQIGREGDFEIVERLYYESDDAMLRAYALAGLAEFEDRDTSEILIRALKRDSFWRIRVTAAEHLADSKADETDELLRYKASNDPVNHVRIAALESLGARGGGENRRYLTEFFRDENRSIELRIACLNVLVKNRIGGAVDAIKGVMEEEWDKPGRFLEFVCRDLSGAEWNALAPAYELMLDHGNWLLKVYGIRGIRRNGILSLEGKVRALDRDGMDGRVRREVTDGR